MRRINLNIVIYIILVLFYLYISLFKISTFVNLSDFDYFDDTGLFYSEAAVRYKYAKIIATGGSIPDIDYKTQYPEGFDTKNEILFPSIVYGNIYKLLPKSIKYTVPFHIFFIYFVSFYTSVNIFIIFLIAKKICSNNLGALLSAITYGLSISSYSRIIGWFNYEDFALPFIFLSLFFFLNNNFYTAILTAIFLSLALISWHLSTFYLTIFTFLCLVYYYLSHPNAKSRICLNTVIILVVLSIPGYLYTPLANRNFISSPGIIILVGIIITHLLNIKYNFHQKKLLLFNLIILFILFSISFTYSWSSRHFRDYGHVYEVIKYKLIFLGKKPDNPMQLPFTARVYWTTPYVIPTHDQIFYLFFPQVLLSLLVVIKKIKLLIKEKNCRSNHEIIILFYLFIFSFLYFFISQRFRVFLIFFLCIYIGQITLMISKNNIKKIVTILLIILLIFWQQQFYLSQLYDNNYQFTNVFSIKEKKRIINDEIRLYQWVKFNLPNERAIFTPNLPMAANLFAFSDSTVLFPSLYENKQIRDKFESLEMALFEEEVLLSSVLKKYNTGYVLYHDSIYNNRDKSSIRYFTNYLDELNQQSAVYLFQFKPDDLKYFRLIQEIGSYKIFEVL